MSILDDFEELSLVGLNIDTVGWHGETLRAKFGAGYSAYAVVGHVGGLHKWTLGAGVLPDDEGYGTIESKSRFEYYQDFFERHTTGEKEIFLLEWRGRKWFAAFVKNEDAYQTHSADTYTPESFEVEQRRVAGYYYADDGSVFEPEMHTDDGMWGLYQADNADSFVWADQTAYDISGRDHHLYMNGDVIRAAAAQNGLDVARFNSVSDIEPDDPAGISDSHTPEDDLTALNGWLDGVGPVTIKRAIFALKVREASFSQYSGLLTAEITTAALVGQSAATKFYNFAFSGYTYSKNGTVFIATNQQAPMNTWGVINAAWSSGITLSNVIIGRDRDFSTRYGKFDIGTIILFDTEPSDYFLENIVPYLQWRWGVA